MNDPYPTLNDPPSVNLPKTAKQRLTVHGQKMVWRAHDRAQGQAAARRRRQMSRGILPRRCEKCGTGEVPNGREVAVCDGCLSKAFA